MKMSYSKTAIVVLVDLDIPIYHNDFRNRASYLSIPMGVKHQLAKRLANLQLQTTVLNT